ncbi:MAG: 7TM diverse intracellular signaling domain-containing protein [Reichenbachiella sp.]|uniref:7TM diverse intracellular signaling domain-containing protein n=1 Tax=Reichenbachiella sp. TaxID=2184521 RepID=UPI0032983749
MGSKLELDKKVLSTGWQLLPIKFSDTVVTDQDWETIPYLAHDKRSIDHSVKGYIQFNNPNHNHLHVVIDLGWVDGATLTITKRDTTILAKLGHFIARSERIQPQNNRFLPSPGVFDLVVDAHETVTITIDSKVIGTFVNIDPRITSFQNWQFERSNMLATRNLWQGVFFGFLLITFLYNLFSFINSRETPHIHYALYVFCLFVTLLPPMEMIYDTFLETVPYLMKHIEMLCNYGFVLFYLLFMRSFLNMKANYPLLNKVIMLNVWLLIILMVVSQITFLVTGLHYLSQWMFQFSCVFSVAVFFYTYVILLYSKDTLARFILIGSIIAIIGACIVLAMLIFSDGFPSNTYYIMQVGYMAELTIFLIGLGVRSKMQLKEAFKASELSEYQSRFFTNISHEFRTPLTLIKGPLSKLLDSDISVEQASDLKYISSNANRLELLINQILELSELENNSRPLNVSKSNIVTFLKSILYSFEYAASKRNIAIGIESDFNDLELYYNGEAVQTIFSNLIFNAIKFTNSGGQINVIVRTNQKDKVLISVVNTGYGISKGKLHEIFNRYYYDQERVSDFQMSSGIGLNLVKELVRWHHGEIMVESNEGVETNFTVSLPLNKSSYSAHEITFADTPVNIDNSQLITTENITPYPDENSKNKEIIVIAEDNRELNSFLTDLLCKQYKVISTLDGMDAWNKISVELPDLIVSDIMMPKLDGIELCKKTKTNLLTSHIPFIILTAKADQKSKIIGYTHSADDYLTKPFEKEELLVRIRNLIDSRKKLRAHFRNEMIVQPKEIAVSSMDERFLRNITSAIEENIANEAFGVETLAEIVHMSRSQLHRKLSALIGQAPNQIIRKVRLNRALKLLQNHTGTISEIAFMTGFSSPNYFSKCFHEHFGYPPKEVKREPNLGSYQPNKA